MKKLPLLYLKQAQFSIFNVTRRKSFNCLLKCFNKSALKLSLAKSLLLKGFCRYIIKKNLINRKQLSRGNC